MLNSNAAVSAAHACRVCGSSARSTEIELREAVFRTWEPFEYFACGGCGTLQIGEVPADLGRHYPSNQYYSFKPQARTLRKRLKALSLRDLCGGVSPVGWLLNRFGVSPPEAAWLRLCRITPKTRILDVGCGGGARLVDLAHSGLRHLSGVDPFIPVDTEAAPGVLIRKLELAEVEESYDLVMFNHSLEHMIDPQRALVEARRVLAPGGRVLVRIPVMDCWAWRHYGADWIQLDPPRHLYLLTQRALEGMAQRAGLHVSEVVYDSTEFQFDKSEEIRAARAARDHVEIPPPIPPTERHARAVALNEQRDGDQACFILTAA